MDRRQFLQLSALLAAGAATGSCAELSPRYKGPEPFTLPDEKLLLTHASVIDVNRGRALKEHAVLIQNGRILKVFPPEAVQPSGADRVMDLQGAYVLPGIINAHCHMSLPGGMGFGPGMLLTYRRQLERNAEECIKHGVTAVRDMLAVSDFLDELQGKIGRGEILGPRIHRCCAMDVHDGYTGRIPLKKKRFWRAVESPEQGRTAVLKAVDQGADFIKLFQQPRELMMPGKEVPMMNEETLRAIREAAERNGKYVALHHTTLEGLSNGLSAGIRSLEHMTTDQTVPESMVHRLLEGDHTLIPTATVAFSLAYPKPGDPNWGKGFCVRIEQERPRYMPDLIREFCEPELVPSTLKYYHQLCIPESYESWHLLPWPDPATMNAAANDGALNTDELYRAGVHFGCGNDGGVPLIFPGAMYVEMRLLEEQGIRPPDILRMATLNNARLLRIEKDLGSVERGKLADLVIFRENPLETVRNTASPELVFLQGRLVYRAGMTAEDKLAS